MLSFCWLNEKRQVTLTILHGIVDYGTSFVTLIYYINWPGISFVPIISARSRNICEWPVHSLLLHYFVLNLLIK